MAKAQKRKTGGALRAVRVVFILLILSCIGLGAYLFLFSPDMGPLENVDEALVFAEGVSVANVPLAGRSLEEAATALKLVEAQMVKDMQFQLDAPGNSVTLTQMDFNVTYNTEEVLQQAILLGNTGTRKERADEKERLLENPRNFELSYTVDVTPVQDRIAELAASVYKEPVDAKAEMDMSVEGFFRYTEGEQGEALDEAELMAQLRDRANSGGYGAVQLPIIYTEPTVTVETLKGSMTLRGKAETSFAKSPYNREDRVYNVKKAANLINGFALKPGEVFSTNDTLGPRTYELGWKPAPAIVQGSTEDQAGGGVCQVSSTLYNAVLKADLEIVNRRNHSSPISYVPRGLDATINTGTIDFTFKNNTESDIFIFAYTFDKKDGPIPQGGSDKTVHIEIWGPPFADEYDEIRLTSEKIETLTPSGEKEVIVDYTKAWDYYEEEVARINGSVYQSYKHYYKNGTEVKSEPLAKSKYLAYAGRIIVGPGYGNGEQLPTQ